MTNSRDMASARWLFMLCVPLCVCLSACSDVPAVEEPEVGTTAQPLVGIRGTYSTWTIPNMPAKGFYNIDGFIYPGNVPQKGAGQVEPTYFYSNQFIYVTGPDGGYIGIQKDGNGQRAIFSIWNANLAACSNVPGAICRPFTGEGDGWQTMIPYAWVAGRTYRTRVWAAGTDPSGEWWVGAIKDMTSGVEQTIGTIRVPYGRGWLGYQVYSWVEWYGAGGSNCSQLPGSVVYFGYPRGNADAQWANQVHNHYGTGACASDVRMESGWARHQNGWW